MNQEAARHSDRLLAVSRHLADVALRSGFPADRLHVHYQGVDTQWWRPHTDTTCVPTSPEHAGQLEDPQPGREELEDGQIPELLFVGAFSKLKGIPNLLRAHAHVSRPHRLVLVGDGPLREELRRASAHDPSITVLGPLDRRGVRERMRRAAALVLPTRTRNGRAEAAGLVSLEAQACATPVIVNETGGALEMVSPACADLKAREYEVDSLVSSINSLLSMSEVERTARGREARSWVEAERSLKRATAELGAHYCELIGSK